MTTSTCHWAIVCRCIRRDMMCACSTRSGRGWGCMSPNFSSMRGGVSDPILSRGGGGKAMVTPAQGGGEDGGVLGPPTDTAARGQKVREEGQE